MKKGLRFFAAVFVLIALLASAAAAAEANGAAGKSVRGDTAKEIDFVSWMYGPSYLEYTVSGTKVKLNWGADTSYNQTGYAVYLLKRTASYPSSLPLDWLITGDDGYYYTPQKILKKTPGTSCTVDLKKAGTYYIGVISYYSSPTSYISDRARFVKVQVTSSTLGKPAGLKATQSGTNKVRLTWKAASNAKSYAVYRATGSGSFKKIGTTKKLKYTDSKVKKGKTYRYKIQAINGTRKKYSSTVSITVGGSDPVSSSAKYRALLIGNSDYKYENDLPNHKYDVKSMKALLGNTLKTKYKVTDKYDCTASDILSAISSAFSGATSKDVSLFYYAGHGVQNSGALEGIDGYCVYPDELRDALLNIPGKVIVILECCHSGAYITKDGTTVKADPAEFNQSIINAFSGYKTTLPDENGDEPKTGELMTDKFIVLTACEMYEESYNWWYFDQYGTVYDGFGTFTKALFKGLGCEWLTASFSGSAPCDSDGNRIATLRECRKYIGKWATSINDEMGTHNVQSCMSYGDSSYPLFRLK